MAVGDSRSSRPPGLQPVGELSQRPLVVDHTQLPDVAPHLRLVFVGLAYVGICLRWRDVGMRGRNVKMCQAECTCVESTAADSLKG